MAAPPELDLRERLDLLKAELAVLDQKKDIFMKRRPQARRRLPPSGL
mgnify:CR=1 FL=1